MERSSAEFLVSLTPSVVLRAAWATPVIHDTRAGLRINAKCQVVDMKGEVIPRLYCGGETAGGFSMHGLARCLCQGFIAGKNAHDEYAEA